jgi:hypothetical protein
VVAEEDRGEGGRGRRREAGREVRDDHWFERRREKHPAGNGRRSCSDCVLQLTIMQQKLEQ